jgi:hypothetical protein
VATTVVGLSNSFPPTSFPGFNMAVGNTIIELRSIARRRGTCATTGWRTEGGGANIERSPFDFAQGRLSARLGMTGGVVQNDNAVSRRFLSQPIENPMR